MRRGLRLHLREGGSAKSTPAGIQEQAAETAPTDGPPAVTEKPPAGSLAQIIQHAVMFKTRAGCVLVWGDTHRPHGGPGHLLGGQGGATEEARRAAWDPWADGPHELAALFCVRLANIFQNKKLENKVREPVL